uniref:Uncharacterized protein n=1 Tax=Oreochromis aureus TaxID=47969 RepID=A0A668S541_OREAU
MCVFRQWLWVKAFSQMVHWYGLSPLWVLMWTVRCSWREHAFPQIAHTNLLRLKKRPHSEQPYGASSPLDTKPLLHTPQTCGLSLLYSNCSPQTPQPPCGSSR